MEQGLADESSHFEHTLVNTADKQLKGFRWLIRYSTISDEAGFIDPGFDKNLNDVSNYTFKTDAINKIVALKRLMSRKNIYLVCVETDINCTQRYFRAEEYGF